ncbi:LemA family protein [plant metagenome]|uniref:LemA family protein n=2 Tax=root TaxID=1 RepID=A0A1C3JWZ2_9BURK|nr:LemA family protein [Orrella dioscoreae]SBT23792.1 LemA family protein [Orrella dioscoreae]SOE49725.1 LemA family protein [Orrella dioscoreae]
MKRLAAYLFLFLSSLSLSGCGYNAMQAADEQVKAAWSEVLNQYQRRADLVPNLVATVKGYAAHEQQVLTDVTNARARVGSVNITADQLDDPQMLQRFQQAQSELSSALSRLLMVTENYPQLKADGLFRDLMVQLEGTENRITVARNRYVQAVQQYNVLVRQFPGVITAKIFGYSPKANFSVENEAAISNAPRIDFGNGTQAPKPAPAQ